MAVSLVRDGRRALVAGDGLVEVDLETGAKKPVEALGRTATGVGVASDESFVLVGLHSNGLAMSTLPSIMALSAPPRKRACH